MTDLAASAPDTAAPSTVLDDLPGQTSGGGEVQPPAENPEPKQESTEPAKAEPKSLRDTIAEEFRKPAEDKGDADDEAKPADESAEGEDGEAEAKEAKPKDQDKPEAKKVEAEEKPEKPAKERDEGGKFKAKEAEPKAEKGERIDAPKSFMPDAKETWRNTPRAVQRDVERMARAHEAEVTQLREATQRYDSLREFDELAQSNGRDLRESLVKLNEMENLMQSNPIAGLNAILQEIGPRKPDGQAASLREVAQFIAQQEEGKYQQMVAKPQPQQPQQNDELAALKQELASVKAQATVMPVIESFKAQHPRYDELKGDIAFFLQSGKVPADLSHGDRLALAYDMAVRINPASHDDTQAADPKSLEPARRAEIDSSGSKSVKTAPGNVSTDDAPKRGGSRADVLRDELRRARGR